MYAPARPGKPVHNVGRWTSPRIGSWTAGDQLKDFGADLPGVGGVVPAGNRLGKFPSCDTLVAASLAIALVPKGVHGNCPADAGNGSEPNGAEYVLVEEFAHYSVLSSLQFLSRDLRVRRIYRHA